MCRFLVAGHTVKVLNIFDNWASLSIPDFLELLSLPETSKWFPAAGNVALNWLAPLPLSSEVLSSSCSFCACVGSLRVLVLPPTALESCKMGVSVLDWLCLPWWTQWKLEYMPDGWMIALIFAPGTEWWFILAHLSHADINVASNVWSSCYGVKLF